MEFQKGQREGREIVLTCTLCWSWKRTAVLTSWSSPSTVVDMTEEPRTVPKYLVINTNSYIMTEDAKSNWKWKNIQNMFSSLCGHFMFQLKWGGGFTGSMLAVTVSQPRSSLSTAQPEFTTHHQSGANNQLLIKKASTSITLNILICYWNHFDYSALSLCCGLITLF